jgi:hypothetical protein
MGARYVIEMYKTWPELLVGSDVSHGLEVVQ